MSETRRKSTELERLALNLDYAFTKGVDLDNRIIWLTEDLEEDLFEYFDIRITALESRSRKAITVRINSFGGDEYTALGIIGRMTKSPCNINTEGYGKVMSASTLILAAGHKRSLSRFAKFMHHESYYGLEGQHSQVKHELAYMDQMEQDWSMYMEEFTGTPKEYWLQNGVGKNLYLSADECLELNVVDEVF